MKLNRAVTLGVSVSLASATAFDGITTGIGSPPPNMTYVDTDLGQLNSPNATNTVNFTFFGEQWALR